MCMADLCYIFNYIIKWFLKSPVFSKPYEVRKQLEFLIFLDIFGFLKNKHLKAIWSSISGIAFEHETTGNMQLIQHVNKC